MARINYWLWFWRVISWDTLLPAALLLIPVAIESIFGKADRLLLVATAALPPIAFALRFFAGQRQIGLNHCSARVRELQGSIFVLGILAMFLVDMGLLFGAMVGLQPQRTLRLFIFVGAAFGFYLMAMIIAMYPGRNAASDDPQV
ncbi:MAG TPA: hypothetical protein VGG30_00575 [Pirellulales bacterium]